MVWNGLEWFKRYTSLPIILKGILHPSDAMTALNAGVDAIIVSNHGGRQLESVLPTMEALPPIVNVINSRIPILLDGGVISGEDIFKALISGANAVLIGRPILWGLAVGGAYGITGVLNQLHRELIQTMKLCGRSNLSTCTHSSTIN